MRSIHHFRTLRKAGSITVLALSLIGIGFCLVPQSVWAQEEATPEVEAVHEVESATHSKNASEDHAETAAAHEDHGDHGEEGHAGGHTLQTPSAFWIAPFVTLLMCIALLPLIPATEHWWHKNTSKLLVSVILALITIGYYYTRDFGFPHGHHVLEPGMATVKAVLNHAVVADYIPFIVLLLSLFVISGGINVRGDVPAHPITNTGIIALGGILASFIGTTGAAMLLIRPLLQINQERKKVVHTVVFFIFVVCNIGGCLLPIGDPPLFLGYLRGVPFMWTMGLAPEWAFCLVTVLVIYFFWDTLARRSESELTRELDDHLREPVKISGGWNAILLLGVVLAVGFLVPGKTIPGLNWTVPELPFVGLREYVQLGLAGISLLFTSKAIRKANDFSFFAINEVACLFIGIFICMQVPVEILNIKGSSLGLQTPNHFFWATGLLSSFLDNAPTYVVFFQTAGTLEWVGGPETVMEGVQTASGTIPIPLLVAISCGAVFMGAMTYIGNGPNFMVKSIAEQAGVKMPSFFGFMIYSVAILVPVYVVFCLLFLL